MNKTLKGIIGGTVLLAALGGVLVFLKQTDPDSGAESSSTLDNAVETPLWHAHADDINRIKVEKPDGTSYGANRKKEKVVTTDADGNSVEEEVANYYLEGLEDLPMNVTLIRTLATRAPDLASIDTVLEHATADDMKRFGLDQPVKVTFSVDKNDDIVFLIGGKIPIDSQRYLCMEGSDTVYTVNGTAMDPFLEDEEYYLGTELKAEQAEDDKTIIKTVRIERKDLDYDLFFEYDPYYSENSNGGSMALHVMKEPVYSLLNGDKSSEATHGMYGLTASEVKLPHPTEADLKKYGFDDPYVTVTTKTDAGDKWLFYLGDSYETEDGDKCHYGMLDGINCIYGFRDDAIIYDNVIAEDVISRNVLDTFVWDIGSLTYKADGTKLEFSGVGSDKSDYVLTYKGAKQDDDMRERYRVLYTYLLQTKAEEIVYEDVELPDQPMAEVSLKRQDGQHGYELKYYDAGDMKAYIMVNGEVRFRCRKSYVETLISNIKIFDDTDKEFTMTW